MIKIEKACTFGWEGAFRGMRNPLNSWSKTDSDFKDGNITLGENDLKLCKALIKAGASDRKFLRMIHVQLDITAPLYWWKEMDQYKISTVTDSCSTMHKIHSRDLTMDDFSTDHLTEENKAVLKNTIAAINEARKGFKETGDKDQWWQMIQLLPSSFNQKRTWDGNYETLIGMYFSRRHHKLDERHAMCDGILELPYMKEFLGALDPKVFEEVGDDDTGL